jgi:hypothetical protein
MEFSVIIKWVVVICIVLGIIMFLFFSTSFGVGYKEIDKEKSNQYFSKGGKVYFSSMGNFFELGVKELKGTDLKSFEVLASNYAKDKNFVYYNGEKILGVDASTFEYLEEGFSKDNTRVYYFDKVLEDANPKTFIYLQRGMGKDNVNVFLEGKLVLEGVIDINTFEIINLNYYKDKNNIYYKNLKLEGVEPNTFEYDYNADVIEISPGVGKIVYR